MKRVMGLFLACGLLLSASSAFADAKHLTLATGGTSGVYFPLGGAIAQVIGSKSDGKFTVTAQATGASGENMRLVQAHDVDFALVQNDVADAAFKGTDPFRPDNKMTDVVAIGRLYPEYLHVVASRDSNVKTLEDFKGKKVSVGARGSGNEVNCRQIFKHFGLNYKNIEPIFLPYGDTGEDQAESSGFHTGYYWTGDEYYSTTSPTDKSRAWTLRLYGMTEQDDNRVSRVELMKKYHLTVRPVCPRD